MLSDELVLPLACHFLSGSRSECYRITTWLNQVFSSESAFPALENQFELFLLADGIRVLLEYLFINISVQMISRYGNVSTVNHLLQPSPETLDSLYVDVSVHILVLRVTHSKMGIVHVKHIIDR